MIKNCFEFYVGFSLFGIKGKKSQDREQVFGMDQQ